MGFASARPIDVRTFVSSIDIRYDRAYAYTIVLVHIIAHAHYSMQEIAVRHCDKNFVHSRGRSRPEKNLAKMNIRVAIFFILLCLAIYFVVGSLGQSG